MAEIKKSKKKPAGKKTRENTKQRSDTKITPKEAYEWKKKYPDLSFAKIGKMFDVCPSAVSNACAKYEKEMGLEKAKANYYATNKVDLLEGLSAKIVAKANQLLDEDDSVKFRELAYAFTQFNQAVRAERGEVTNDLAGFMNLVDKVAGNRIRKVNGGSDDKIIEAEVVEINEEETEDVKKD